MGQGLRVRGGVKGVSVAGRSGARVRVAGIMIAMVGRREAMSAAVVVGVKGVVVVLRWGAGVPVAVVAVDGGCRGGYGAGLVRAASS